MADQPTRYQPDNGMQRDPLGDYVRWADVAGLITPPDPSPAASPQLTRHNCVNITDRVERFAEATTVEYYRADEVDALLPDSQRLEAQARDISVMLSDAGINAMPIPEAVRTLIRQRDEARERLNPPPAASPGVDPWDDIAAILIEWAPEPRAYAHVDGMISRARAAERQQHTEREADLQKGQDTLIRALESSEAEVASLTQQLTEAKRAAEALNIIIHGRDRIIEHQGHQLTEAQTQIETLRAAVWQPIETAPKNVTCWFWICPKTAEETYHDTSGNPILARVEPHPSRTKYGQWGSLFKATHWMPSPEPPSPLAASLTGDQP